MEIRIIKELLEKYNKGEASPAEQRIIEQWLETSNAEGNEWALMTESQKAAWEHRLAKDIQERVFNQDDEVLRGRPKMTYLPWYRKLYLQIAAAIIIVAAGVGIFSVTNSKLTEQPFATVEPENEVLPGSNKAILTLGDGSTVTLDDSGDGVLATEGNAAVKKQGDLLIYDASPLTQSAKAVAYNSLVTPRGGQYKMVLPDGSKVWLNAASRIKYPVVFSAVSREVEINGEAYFEIAQQFAGKRKVPFVVHVKAADGAAKADVEVLGTHFNVNAYDDEEQSNTTLLEGSVKIISTAGSSAKQPAAIVLTPGQQAQVTNWGKVTVEEHADVEEVMAWKNGLFLLNKTPIAAVLRQLCRWYDVDVNYGKQVPVGRISGDIPRNLNLSEALKIIELSGIKFKLADRKIVIEP